MSVGLLLLFAAAMIGVTVVVAAAAVRRLRAVVMRHMLGVGREMLWPRASVGSRVRHCKCQPQEPRLFISTTPKGFY